MSVYARIILLLGLTVFAVAQNPIAQNPVQVWLHPPETAVREVTDRYFGTDLVDPYRWLEDLKSPEVAAWMKAQNDYTHSTLDRIPGRERLRARIAQLDDTGVRISNLQSYSGRWFYLKQTPGDDLRKLYMREGSLGSERLLLDPQTLTANSVHFSIDYFQASPDAKLIAVGISPGGSENSVLHVFEADSGYDVRDRTRRARS